MSIDEIRRRRRRKPGDINALRRTLWAALLEIEDLLASDDPNLKIRAAHALGTLAGTYLRAMEQADIVERLDRLEERDAGVMTPRRLAA
jgi:hypothetical protein